MLEPTISIANGKRTHAISYSFANRMAPFVGHIIPSTWPRVFQRPARGQSYYRGRPGKHPPQWIEPVGAAGGIDLTLHSPRLNGRYYHPLGLARLAERIIFREKGRVVEEGTKRNSGLI